MTACSPSWHPTWIGHQLMSYWAPEWSCQIHKPYTSCSNPLPALGWGRPLKNRFWCRGSPKSAHKCRSLNAGTGLEPQPCRAWHSRRVPELNNPSVGGWDSRSQSSVLPRDCVQLYALLTAQGLSPPLTKTCSAHAEGVPVSNSQKDVL